MRDVVDPRGTTVAAVDRVTVASVTDARRAHLASPIVGSIGDRVGRYHLDRILGAGGMGVVYRAFDPELDRAVAIKFLRPGTSDAEARLCLLREARAMARVTHRNVVSVFEVGSEDGHDFVVMELIDGVTLARWLRQSPLPRHAAILDAFVDAGRGLAAAHAAGMVHRDFKPDNVLRTHAGRVMVCDFGLARGVDCELPAERTSLAQITESAGLYGTPAYMAPEQWAGGVITAATDQWAFCVAVWEALTGERPFATVSREAARAGTARWDLPSGAGLPRALRRVLVRGLDPDPARRWSSMDALLAQIRHARSRTFAGFAVLAIAGALCALPRIAGEELAASASASTEPSISACAVDPIDARTRSTSIADRAAAQLLDDDFARASRLRDRACDDPAAASPRVVACLDGVLARLDAVRRAAQRVRASDRGTSRAAPHAGAVLVDSRAAPTAFDAASQPIDVGALLVDPAVCATVDPPILRAAWSDDAVDGFAAQLAGTFEATRSTDACARTLALFGRRDRRAATETLAYAAICGDERLHADAWLARLDVVVERARFGVVENTLRRAADAIRRVEQPDLAGALELMRARYAASRGATTVELRHLDAAIETLGRRPRLRLATLERKVAAANGRSDAAELASQQHWLVVAGAHAAHAHHAPDHAHD